MEVRAARRAEAVEEAMSAFKDYLKHRRAFLSDYRITDSLIGPSNLQRAFHCARRRYIVIISTYLLHTRVKHKLKRGPKSLITFITQ